VKSVVQDTVFGQCARNAENLRMPSLIAVKRGVETSDLRDVWGMLLDLTDRAQVMWLMTGRQRLQRFQMHHYVIVN